jgi:hypothetical protein
LIIISSIYTHPNKSLFLDSFLFSYL